MLLEIAKPVALLLCLLSLYALFHAVFMVPAGNYPALSDLEIHAKILNTLILFAFSAANSIVGGLIFRETDSRPHPSLHATLPMQLFYWALGLMVIVFFVSWYLETHVIFYRSTARW